MKNDTRIHSLAELLRSEFYSHFTANKLGNDLFISDPERASRCNDAACDGADGSTHAEVIEDMREANGHAEREVYRAQFAAFGFDGFCVEELATALRDYIAAEIDACEAFHEKAGTLNNQIR